MRPFFYSLALAAGMASMVAFAQDPTLTQFKWNDKAFQASPWEGNGDEIGWLIFRDARGRSPLVDTAGLLEEYAKEPVHAGTPVLIIRSYTYLVPFTFDESRRMPDYIKKKQQDANWKRKESELVAKLIEACKAKRIRLLVNTSMDLKKPWKILTEAQ